jgi:hypothetical protein
MADEYVDMESAIQTVLKADSTLTALLGSMSVSSGAVLNEALDDSETGIDITGTAPTAADIWKIDDELIQVSSFSSPTATVVRGYDSTTAAAHDTGINITLYTPSVHLQPRTDLTTYHINELPVISISCDSEEAFEDNTIGEFLKTYNTYLEVVHMGSDLTAVVNSVKRIMAEVQRIMRAEKFNNQPLNSTAHDIETRGAQLIRGRASGSNPYVASMFTNIVAQVISTT